MVSSFYFIVVVVVVVVVFRTIRVNLLWGKSFFYAREKNTNLTNNTNSHGGIFIYTHTYKYINTENETFR